MPLTVGTNSYATVAEAQTYLWETLRSNDWNPVTPSSDPDVLTGQEAALITAARLIDRQPLRGCKLDSAQALAFPRDYTDGVPVEVKHAAIETAYWLLTDYLKRRAAPPPTLDLANFMGQGFGGPQGTSGIKLAVERVTIDAGSTGDEAVQGNKITFTPAEPVTIPQLPTTLPEAALLLLKDHLAVEIGLIR